MPSRRDFVVGSAGAGLIAVATGKFLLSEEAPPPPDVQGPAPHIDLRVPTPPPNAQRSTPPPSAQGPAPTDPCLNVHDFGARGDGSTDDSKAVQAAIDEASQSTSIVYLPAGEYPVTIEVRDGVQIHCAPGTTLRAAGTGSVVRLTGDDSGLWNAAVIGSRNRNPRRGLAAHCIEVRGSNVRLDRVRPGGARYDSLYIRSGPGVVIRGSKFGPSARNTCSIVSGSEIWFEGCEFFQDTSISSQRHNGLYLYDIEPEGDNRVSGVTHLRCTFKTDLRSGYAGVILDAGGSGDGVDNEVSFYHCSFAKGASRAPSIRLRGGRVFRGLTLIGNTFDGMLFTSENVIRLTDSMLVANEHSSSRFAYNVILGNVLVVGHQGTGLRGLNSTDATQIVPTDRLPGA